jgi:hypothetical protein
VRNKKYYTPLAVGLAFAFFSAQAMAQESTRSDLGPKPAFVGSIVTCIQLPSRIRVPLPLLEQERVKAQLAILLRESLADDANGIVNVAREKEIRKLANKLVRERD